MTAEPYGVTTGARNGFWVLDLDVKADRNGAMALYAEMGDNELPSTYTVRTPSGGWHMYFAWDETRPIRNRQHVLPGVDVRGEGGYVCAGGEYAVTDPTEPAAAPEWLYGLIQNVGSSEEVPTPAHAIGPDHEHWQFRLDHATRWLTGVAPCIQGQGGDSHLASVALRLMRTYELPVDTALTLLEPFNARCQPPWDEPAIRRKLVWAAERGTGPTGMFGPEWHGDAAAPAPPDGGPDPKKVPGSWRKTHDPNHQYTYDLGAQAGGGSGRKSPMDQASVTGSLAGGGAHPAWCGVWQYDAFSERILAVDPPLRLDAEDRGMTDVDTCNIRQWYAFMGMAVTKEQINDAIASAASAASFHPIRDYLDSLEDPSPKSAADFFQGIAGKLWGAAPVDDGVESELFKRQCVAACRRVRQPGVKSDDMLILYGEQGFGKSRFLRKLFGDEHFLDHLPGNWHDKDTAAALRGKWGIEVAELTGFARTEENTRKAFLSRQEDDYRGAFERGRTRRRRQCVFFGSTNDELIFTDPTGGRRYNVVHVRQEIDVDAFDRDQLWAAANALERSGYTHFFDRIEGAALAERRASHHIGDPWDDVILDYMARQKGKGESCIDANAVLSQCVGMSVEKRAPADLARVRAVLRRLCGASQVRKLGGRTVRAYAIPESLEAIASPVGQVVAIRRS